MIYDKVLQFNEESYSKRKQYTKIVEHNELNW